jgi:hypothetical protein
VVVTLITDPLRRSTAASGNTCSRWQFVERRARTPDDGGTFPQQFLGDAVADAAAGAGDDGDLAIQLTHVLPPSG